MQYKIGSNKEEWAYGVSTDSSDAVYIVGTTEGGLDGNSNAGTEGIGEDSRDVFVVKYNSDGIKQWTRQIGSNQIDEGKSITADSIGNIYVTGFTQGNLDGNTLIGSRNYFIVKF